MKKLKTLQLKILFWLLGIEKYKISEGDEKYFLAGIHPNKGFQSWCKYRNIEILKNIAIAVQGRDFQTAIELNGQRIELLYLQAQAIRAHKELHT